ncbi:type III restriction-modification system endonuclease [Clostridium tertium]|uniref:type III restriction-modification system endonuclease n=1 Tax=Clostridium tertium TaxID=1559 RepID=UPI000BE36BF0|nr:DEAD/DEAH box helicase family protein [Clostridium tertium]
MKLQFNSELDYQNEAIESITNIFKGQRQCKSNFTVVSGVDESGTEGKLLTDTGIGNKLDIDEEDILKNVREIQLKNGLPPSSLIRKDDYHFDIEMETGTGKTYVFLRTIFELNAKYGFTKFIIVVPSVAIKEGVVKSIEMMTEHFKGLYNNVIFKSSEYTSKNLDMLRDFAISDNIRIMVMTVQSFNKDTNVINVENEKTNGLKPLQFIQKTKPIVIIDEPQTAASTQKANEAIDSLNPLCTLRYSATHKKINNLMFKLDAIDAYERQLVKQIEVASSVSKENNNLAYLKLVSVDNKKSPITAKIEIDRIKDGKIKREEVTVRVGDDLYDASGRRDLYEGYIVSEIFTGEGREYVSFTTKPTIKLGEVNGELDDDTIKRLQIRKTIEEHLDKELRLTQEGIKVLSLFFIDRVSNYRIYDESGKAKKGKYAIWFEEEYKKLIELPKYNTLLKDVDIETEVEQVHNGYFAQDKKGIVKDTKGNTAADEDVYSLIMKDKEKLLSFNTKLRFIFSHSALKEGWDNPNVFQICTLNETKSESKKRQEIGRGLRLAVNQDGERVYGFNINTLTVMANESYEKFAEELQKEYEEDGTLKFGVVEKHTFANIVIKKDGESKYLEQEGSESIWNHLKKESYIDAKGKVTKELKVALKEETFELPEEFNEIKPQVIKVLKKLSGNLNIKNADDKVKVNLNKQRFLSPEFKELWEKIKYKTTFSVDFDTAKLIETCVKEIKETVSIGKIKQIYTKANLDYTISGIIAEETDKYTEDIEEVRFNLPDIITYLQNETQLTRRTIVEILKQSGKLQDFKNNPQKFMDTVSEIIKRKMRYLIVDGIKYEKLGDEEYYAQELFEEEELYGYLSKNMLETDKSVYNYVIYDSDIESSFAQAMEKNKRVKVYAKLPGWFTIDTPLGKYNPDWAVFIEKNNSEKLYFVFETKGSIISEDLRAREEAKIKCGEKHFKALNTDIEFIKTDTFDRVIEKI